VVDGRCRIVSDPPVVVPARDLAAVYGLSPDEAEHGIREQFRAYRATLQDDRRRLLERFEIVDMARKVVGVGSVGTRAFIVSLEGRDARDPITDFSERYANQNERDYQEFITAVQAGRLEARDGV
jgi:hypothetical protein